MPAAIPHPLSEPPRPARPLSPSQRSQCAGSPRPRGPRLIPFNDDSTNDGALHVDRSPEPKHFRRHVARQAFGSGSPLGHTIRDGREKFVIIGVVRDSKYAWLSDHQRPAYFESHTMSDPVVHFMVRAGVDPESLVRPLRRAMLDVDPSAAIEVKPMRRALGMALLPSRVGAFLLGLMGALSLALTANGLPGLMSYSVARRIREIGLRIALGATPARIRQLVFAEGAWLVGIGLGIGLLASVFLTKPLAQFPVESLTHSDPLTYVAVTLLTLLAAPLACAIPARRPLRIHPMEALR